MWPVSCFTLHDICHSQRAVNDSVCKRHMTAPDWRRYGAVCMLSCLGRCNTAAAGGEMDVVLLLQARNGHDPGADCQHWLAT